MRRLKLRLKSTPRLHHQRRLAATRSTSGYFRREDFFSLQGGFDPFKQEHLQGEFDYSESLKPS
jgi:hypothetical protein